MAPLGLVEWVDEPLFDAATALAGSGPAFAYRFIDALAAGAATLGLDPAQALRMALATVAGAARLAEDAREHPAMLADRVASKGGSTRAGLDVLDQDEALLRLVEATLAAAERRNHELAALNPR
jgi:pyrroline-5-carboxylate reductase